MRIGRLEFGIVRKADKSVNFYPFDLCTRGCCGCVLFEVSCLYVTWLGDECYGATLERKGKVLKRLAGLRRARLERTTPCSPEPPGA